MEIRRATVDEWKAVRDIRLRALGEAPNAFCSTHQREAQFDDHTWQQRLSTATTFLAWEHDATVGTVTGKDDPHEPGSRELAAMWVDPVARHAGVASALIASIFEWARGEQSRAIALWVAEDNHSARRLYEKCGFLFTGERDVMREGVDQLRMRCQLA
jgi:GNAT superfamily N-acetyltransferase